MKFLDNIGVAYLWSKIKDKIESVVAEQLSNYINSFNTIQQQASSAADSAENYYNLTTQAINSLNPNVAETLTYAQLVAKHGDAIKKIAQSLNATYSEENLDASNNYTPGFIFVAVTQEQMDELLANGTTEANKVYFVEE